MQYVYDKFTWIPLFLGRVQVSVTSELWCVSVDLRVLFILKGCIVGVENRAQTKYCGMAPMGHSIERPLLINGYACLAVSLLISGLIDSNS
jgi:hypothetical protein